ncbi:hypothetical protein F4604DRAFT_1683863 [Suillus subluteus]|nr:hypothetical protein F4604DRAFT_1683863 [Suillus subluteus]
MAITVTPLKLLQKDHVKEFEEYGIRSITIHFVNRIGFFFIDEAHFISTAGEAQPGEKVPFRVAMLGLSEMVYSRRSMAVIRMPRSIFSKERIFSCVEAARIQTAEHTAVVMDNMEQMVSCAGSYFNFSATAQIEKDAVLYAVRERKFLTITSTGTTGTCTFSNSVLRLPNLSEIDQPGYATRLVRGYISQAGIEPRTSEETIHESI